MGVHRANRLAEEMKKEISEILRDEIKDPRVGFVSVTRVEVSSDLRYARVYVSVLGDPVERGRGKALKRQDSLDRLAHRIRLHTPRTDFKLDESIEHGIQFPALQTRSG